MTSYEWFEAEVPNNLEIRQVGGFIFNDAGQILLLEDEGKFSLPGGGPEGEETMSETLIREVDEEVQVTIKSINYLGYQFIAGTEEFAQVRLICQLDEIFPSEPDPITGRTYSRLWVPPVHANDLLWWGESGEQQIASALRAASKIGVTFSD